MKSKFCLLFCSLVLTLECNFCPILLSFKLKNKIYRGMFRDRELFIIKEQILVVLLDFINSILKVG